MATLKDIRLRLSTRPTERKKSRFGFDRDRCPGICLKCRRFEMTELRPSQTSYTWDGAGEDPNAPLRLCDACGEEYRREMDDLWAEYHGGLL